MTKGACIIHIRTIEAVHLTSFGRKTNHEFVTIVNIHHNSLYMCTRCFDGQFLSSLMISTWVHGLYTHVRTMP